MRDNDIAALPPQLSQMRTISTLSLSGNPLRSVPHHVQQKGTAAVLELLARRMPLPG